jgi:hypothetical protein
VGQKQESAIMKKPNFYHGIAVAFFLSFFGSALFAVLTPIYSGQWVLRVVITLLALAYLLYLFSSSPARTGKATTLIIWLTVSGLSWFLTPPLLVYILIHIGMIWLVRSLYHYQSVIAAAADMGLNALSLITAIWALESTGSLFLSLWCYFLLQALFVVIPANLKRAALPPLKSMEQSMGQSMEDEGFQRAYRSAEAALRRMG